MKFMKLGSKPDSFKTGRDDVRFVATEFATDVVVNVAGIKFFLHKFPVLYKCSRLQKLAATTTNNENIVEIEIPDIPGGPAAFEVCAKYCYGMTFTLNAYNVVAALCGADYLEMHDPLEKGNLIYKIDVFLNTSLFRSWKDSIVVLQTTKSFLPMAEDLKVINHCVDAIASKASTDPSRVKWSFSYNRKKLPTDNNGSDTNWNGVKKQHNIPKDWWVEDLCELDLDFYKRVMAAISSKGRISSDVIGESLKAYTYTKLPSFSCGLVAQGGDIAKHCTLVETIVRLLPPDIGCVSCRFYLKLLRAATALGCSATVKKELVRRTGTRLHEATISDLLIPGPEREIGIYDVDVVQRIVEEFLKHDHDTATTHNQNGDCTEEFSCLTSKSLTIKLAVAHLIDGYLAEIGRDRNLLLSKFINLAEMVSPALRPVHDGLYKAIDMFLKEHPNLSKCEKKKLCNLIDCKKLSANACTHAVQNDRLPLRIAVQVLFFEQSRAAAASTRRSHTSSTRSTVAITTKDPEGLKAFKSTKHVTGSEKSNGINKNLEGKGQHKVKGMVMPRTMFSKLLSGRGQGGENCSSDTSESLCSASVDVSRSMPSRNARHSVS